MFGEKEIKSFAAFTLKNEMLLKYFERNLLTPLKRIRTLRKLIERRNVLWNVAYLGWLRLGYFQCHWMRVFPNKPYKFWQESVNGNTNNIITTLFKIQWSTTDLTWFDTDQVCEWTHGWFVNATLPWILTAKKEKWNRTKNLKNWTIL